MVCACGVVYVYVVCGCDWCVCVDCVVWDYGVHVCGMCI